MSSFKKFLAKRDDSKDNPKGEMSFVDHIEELRWHIIRSLVVILVGSIVIFIYSQQVFDYLILGPTRDDFLTYKFMCWLGDQLNVDALCMGKVQLEFQNTKLAGQFLMSFSVSFILGFIVAFPICVLGVLEVCKTSIKS